MKKLRFLPYDHITVNDISAAVQFQFALNVFVEFLEQAKELTVV